MCIALEESEVVRLRKLGFANAIIRNMRNHCKVFSVNGANLVIQSNKGSSIAANSHIMQFEINHCFNL